ncbi:MAG: glucosamine-6-phosphate deaminase [Ginsengibacter sp.]
MKIFIGDNYEMMSKQAGADIISITQSLKNPVLCTASGDTPAGLYKELVNEVHQNKIDISRWYFVSLDEWVGMNGDDEGSCRFHLNNQLFNPLQVAKDHISFFNGREKNLNNECENMENFIRQHEGLDIAVIGLGMNGHVGMNEPGTSPELHSHVTDIDSQTQKIGQKYFKKDQQLSKGITLGLATLMEARNIILLVSGRHKAQIVQKVLKGEISEKIPATLLRSHPGLKIYLDKEAASLVQAI